MKLYSVSSILALLLSSATPSISTATEQRHIRTNTAAINSDHDHFNEQKSAYLKRLGQLSSQQNLVSIENGKQLAQGVRPYLVSIGVQAPTGTTWGNLCKYPDGSTNDCEYYHFCGGTLISPQVVLTAARKFPFLCK